MHEAMREALIKNGEEKFLNPQGLQSPWIFDFRKLLLKSDTLDAASRLFLDELKGLPRFQIGGLETASIALVGGMLLRAAHEGRPLNGFYIRKSRKKDGLQRQIEGNLTDEDVVLVDDILNSGRSFMRQIAVLEQEGRRVSAICVLLRFRDLSWYEEFSKRGIRIHSIFSLEDFPGVGMRADEEKLAQPRTPYEVEWRFQSKDPSLYYVVPKSAPVCDDERVYFGADNGTMWALNQSDGSVAWEFRTLFGVGEKRIFSSPALAYGKLYFGAYDGNFYCLDAASGKKIWVFREADWIGSSPTVAEDRGVVFVGLEFGLWKKEGGLVCLDLETGTKKWQSTLATYVHSSPRYSKKLGIVVVGSSAGTVNAYDAASGALIWSVQAEGAVRASFAFDDRTGTVAFGAEDSHIYIVRAGTGEVLHRIPTFEPIYATPLSLDGTLYFGLLDKRIVAVDMESGTLLWQHWTHARVFSTPVLIGGRLIIGANDGRLYELDAKTGKELSYYQVSERIVNRIAHNASTGKIFLPTHANELYCLRRAN
jgi:outer membrane protein assembly factor BamB/orotate phosphoribosyltransferase